MVVCEAVTVLGKGVGKLASLSVLFQAADRSNHLLLATGIRWLESESQITMHVPSRRLT